MESIMKTPSQPSSLILPNHIKWNTSCISVHLHCAEIKFPLPSQGFLALTMMKCSIEVPTCILHDLYITVLGFSVCCFSRIDRNLYYWHLNSRGGALCSKIKLLIFKKVIFHQKNIFYFLCFPVISSRPCSSPVTSRLSILSIIFVDIHQMKWGGETTLH